MSVLNKPAEFVTCIWSADIDLISHKLWSHPSLLQLIKDFLIGFAKII